jgi:hypothetical protein
MTKILSNKSNIDLDYPICRPSLDLDFTQEVLDPRITFSRGSIGTRVNRNRLIETVSANQPRFDYDPVTGECKGLLIEESRTNLITYSETLQNYTDTRLTNSTVSTGGPFGTGYLEKTVNDTVSSAYNFHNTNQISLTAGQTITFSIFFKNISINPNEIYIRFWTGAGRAWTTQRQVRYNLSSLTTTNMTGTIVNKSIQAFPDGWYRLSMTATADQNGFSAESVLVVPSNVGDKYQITGAQLETGAFPTSYIPTVASTVTRSADLAQMTGTNFSSWYNQSEGTLYSAARINALGGSGYPGIAYVDDGTINNCIGIVVMDASNDQIATEAFISGATQYFLGSGSAIIPNQLNKVITSYFLNNFSSAFSNRNNIQRDINGLIPTVNRLILGDLRGGNAKLNGTIARFTYYPKKLKDNQLLYLTQ